MMRPIYALGNAFFQRCYPLYRPLYISYKILVDRQERRQVRNVVHSGMTVVDVGAGIGAYTQLLSGLVGREGRVYAFEPSPVNFQRLERSVAGQDNVTAVQAAVGERTGATSLFLSDELNVDHRTYDTGEGRSRIGIPAFRLDDYFPPGTRIDFMKIDVQGYELSVLMGAERIVRENSEIKLLVEFWPHGLAQAGVKPAALLGYLRSRGLSFGVVGNTSKECFESEQLDAVDKNQYWNLMVARAN